MIIIAIFVFIIFFCKNKNILQDIKGFVFLSTEIIRNQLNIPLLPEYRPGEGFQRAVKLLLAAAEIAVAEAMESRGMVGMCQMGELMAYNVFAELRRQKKERARQRDMAVGGVTCAERAGAPPYFPAAWCHT